MRFSILYTVRALTGEVEVPVENDVEATDLPSLLQKIVDSYNDSVTNPRIIGIKIQRIGD